MASYLAVSLSIGRALKMDSLLHQIPVFRPEESCSTKSIYIYGDSHTPLIPLSFLATRQTNKLKWIGGICLALR
jgi:hypothetical protein